MFHAVVSNSREEKLTWDEERINAFYGCPFVVGIDIYPLDYVPKEQGRQDIQRLVYTLGFGLTGQMEQIFSKPYTVTLSEIDENPEAVLKRDSCQIQRRSRISFLPQTDRQPSSQLSA